MERLSRLVRARAVARKEALTLTASPPAKQPPGQADSDSGGSQQPDVVSIVPPLYQISVKKLRLDLVNLTNRHKALFNRKLETQVQEASEAGATVTIWKGREAQAVPLLAAYRGLQISLEPPVPQRLQSSSGSGGGGRGGSGGSGGSGGGSGGSGSSGSDGSGNLFSLSCYSAFHTKLSDETLVDAVQQMILLVAKANFLSTVVRALMPQLIITTLARGKKSLDKLEAAVRTSRSQEGRALRRPVGEAQAEIWRLMGQCVDGTAHMLAAFTNHESRTAGFLEKDVSSAVAAVTAAQRDGGDVKDCINAYVEHAEVLSAHFLKCWDEMVVPRVHELKCHGVILTNSFPDLHYILRQQIMQAAGLLGVEAEAARLLESIGESVAGWDTHNKRTKAALLLFQDHSDLIAFMHPHGGALPMSAEYLLLCSMAHMEGRVMRKLQSLEGQVQQVDGNLALDVLLLLNMMEMLAKEIKGGASLSPEMQNMLDMYRKHVSRTLAASGQQEQLEADLAAAVGQGVVVEDQELTPEQSGEPLCTGKDEPALVGMTAADEACELVVRLKLQGEPQAAGAQARR